jgi:MFS family permease
MAIGPTLGGAVAAWLGWRWIFLANIPFCILAGWIVPRLIAEERASDTRPFDPLGVGLLTLALGAAIETLLAGRTSTHVAIGIAGSLGAAALFVLQQRRRERPLLDPAVLAQPAMIAVALLLITVSIGYWAVLVYLPLFLASAFGLAAEQSGVVLLAATVPMIFLPPLAGHLATRWGWRALFASGLAIIALGDLVLAGTQAGADPFLIALAGMVVIAIGAALVQAQLSGAVVALAPPAQAGMASALTIVMRQGGFAIGIALLGATLGSERAAASSYVPLFLLAAAASLVGVAAAWLLLPRPESIRALRTST